MKKRKPRKKRKGGRRRRRKRKKVLSLQFSVLVYLMEAVSFAVGFHRASVAQRAQVPSTEP
jgi:hypothetical protein